MSPLPSPEDGRRTIFRKVVILYFLYFTVLCTKSTRQLVLNVTHRRQNLLELTLTRPSTVLLEKLTVPRPLNNLSAFYGSKTFITAFTTANQLSYPQSSSHLHVPLPLHQVVPNCFSLSDFHTKTLHEFHFLSIRATCPAHLTLLYLITRTVLFT